MALEIRKILVEAHDMPILCACVNVNRGLLYTGSQDSTIKIWENDNGRLVRVLTEHSGWVTGLVYSSELKLLFSCGVDNQIIVWNGKGDALQREKVSGPLYCLLWDSKKRRLIAGSNERVYMYHIDEQSLGKGDLGDLKLLIPIGDRDKGLIGDPHNSDKGHTDMVRTLASCSSSGRVFSSGYDRKVCLYPADHPTHIKCSTTSHEKGVSAMCYDSDNNWLITGSFDQTLRMWSPREMLHTGMIEIQRMTDLNDAVTGLCYIPATRALWTASNSSDIQVYEPRLGLNITNYLTSTSVPEKKKTTKIQKLFWMADSNELLATTASRELIVWKYDRNAAATILRKHEDWVETVCAMNRSGTIVIFSGGADCRILKWESYGGANPGLYYNIDEFTGHSSSVVCSLYHEQGGLLLTGSEDCTVRAWNSEAGFIESDGANKPPQQREEDGASGRRASVTETTSAFEIPSQERFVLKAHTARVSAMCRTQLSVRKTIKIKKDAAGNTLERKESTIHPKFTPRGLVRGQSVTSQDGGADSTGRRGRGLLKKQQSRLKETLQAPSPSSGATVVESESDDEWEEQEVEELEYILITVSWDKSVCFWDLTTGELKTQMLDAHDDMILGVDVSTCGHAPKNPCENAVCSCHASYLGCFKCPDNPFEFATCSANKLVNVWDIHTKTLKVVLVGHEDEVSQVKWNTKTRNWVTSSEDRTIRIWSRQGAQLLVLNCEAEDANVLCIDKLTGYIVAGSKDFKMRVYEPTTGEMIRTYHGHTDVIRSIIHVPEKNQYLSASWDGTIRVWHSRRDKINTANRGQKEEDPDEGAQWKRESFAKRYPLKKPQSLMKQLPDLNLNFEKPSNDRKAKARKNEDNMPKSRLEARLNDLEAQLTNHVAVTPRNKVEKVKTSRRPNYMSRRPQK